MQLRTSDVRLCMLQRSIKDWEKQMEKHAALMATRKKAQKAASRPTDDSERRVRQRRESQAQADADTGGAAERRMTKRLEAQYARVQQLEDVELLDALRSCIVHYSDDERYAQARRALACAVYRMDYVCCDEFGEPNGDPVWDADFDDATDRVPLIRNCLQASLPRRAPLRQRPAIELWQIDWLLKYEDQGTGWDEALAANSPPAGTTMAAVTGRDVVDFLQRERRKGLAEAAFEAHLQRIFDSQGRSCYSNDCLRDGDSAWWREALGPQHKRSGALSSLATEKERATYASALCSCNMRVCRCPIGCVLDTHGLPVEPQRFAMSEEC